jgi:hypothetical protein
VLPLPGPEVLQAAVEHTGGSSACPSRPAGAAAPAALGEAAAHATYFFPSPPQLPITQYVPTMRRYLEQLGRADVEVMGSRSDEVLDRFGTSFALNVGRGIIAIEYLLRSRYELRPYEVAKGSVDAAYQEALATVVDAQAQDKVSEGLAAAVRRLRTVETRGRGTRPIIGIAGDVYTRVNAVANGGLFELLEDLGCEVWLSPTIVDIAITRNEPIPGRMPRYRELWESTTYWAANLVKSASLWQVQRQFKACCATWRSPPSRR